MSPLAATGGHWVVVADRGHARVFRRTSSGRLEEIESLVNPGARMRDRDVYSDTPGRGLNRSRTGRFAMAGRADNRGRVAQTFARRLARKLRAARLSGGFTRLDVVAEPAFLGTLRKAMDAGTRSRVTLALSHGGFRMDPEALRTLLNQHRLK